MANSYIEFCKANAGSVAGMSFIERGKKLGQMWRDAAGGPQNVHGARAKIVKDALNLPFTPHAAAIQVLTEKGNKAAKTAKKLVSKPPPGVKKMKKA